MIFVSEILQLVRESIRNYPNRPAFYIQDEEYSYRQFAERISAIRGVVRVAAVDEPIWGLAIQDNLDTYAAIIALWMEGKAYVPLHPAWPVERIGSIIDQIGLKNILVSDDTLTIYPSLTPFTIHDTSQAVYEKDLLDGWRDVSDDDLAYILFTSGATGVRKGGQRSR